MITVVSMTIYGLFDLAKYSLSQFAVCIYLIIFAMPLHNSGVCFCMVVVIIGWFVELG